MALRFAWITDSHCYVGDGSRVANVQTACDYADANSFDYIVHTGDMGNDSAANTQLAMDVMNAATTPLLWCNGNHSEIEDPVGTPSTAAYEVAALWNQSAPFYHTTQITGSGGEKARVLSLDCNIYDDSPLGDLDSPDHTPGDRIGYHSSNPPGGYYRQFGATQLTWVETTLSGDSTSDYIIVLTHFPPQGVTQTDYASLADKLQADGRPVVILCGHNHPKATSYTLTTTDELDTYTMYKCPGMQESGSFTDLQITWNGTAPTVAQATVRNYYHPATSWTFEAPFDLEATLMIFAKV